MRCSVSQNLTPVKVKAEGASARENALRDALTYVSCAQNIAHNVKMRSLLALVAAYAGAAEAANSWKVSYPSVWCVFLAAPFLPALSAHCNALQLRLASYSPLVPSQLVSTTSIGQGLNNNAFFGWSRLRTCEGRSQHRDDAHFSRHHKLRSVCSRHSGGSSRRRLSYGCCAASAVQSGARYPK